MIRIVALGVLVASVARLAADDATSTIAFQTAAQVVSEGNGTIPISVVRRGDLTQMASVQYATIDGSAVSGADYVIANGTISFGIGESTQTVFITLVNDGLAELSESFQVELTTAGGNGVVGSPSAQTITITDDDSGSATGGTTTSGSGGRTSTARGCGHGAAAPLAIAGLALLAGSRPRARR